MTKILIADDHNMFINGLKLILSTRKGYEVAAVAKNGKEVLSFLTSGCADVIIMDINMPVLNGYETTLLLRAEFPHIPVIALSMLADKTSVTKMLEAGAKGYLFKNANDNELFQAIDTVTAGDYYVTGEMISMLHAFEVKKRDLLRGYAKVDIHPLSTREIDIVRLIIEGFTNVEIANRLFLSTRTVDTHRKNILSKLGLKNTASLVKYVMDNKAFLGIN